jgi:hypothetical protein
MVEEVDVSRCVPDIVLRNARLNRWPLRVYLEDVRTSGGTGYESTEDPTVVRVSAKASPLAKHTAGRRDQIL